MFWSSSTNWQHSLNPYKHSLLMTRDSIVFSVKHKLQQCHNGNKALYSTLASLWWSKTYFYPMSMSLVSDITMLWLWPRIGLTRASPVSSAGTCGWQRKSIWKCPGEITARKSTSTQLLACSLNILMVKFLLFHCGFIQYSRVFFFSAWLHP